MGSTWKYVEQTRGHALETVMAVDEGLLGRIVAYLERTPAPALYRAFRSSQEDAIKWLGASGSQRKRKFKSAEEEVVIIAAAMWYGRLAYKTIRLLDERGAVQGGPGYRDTTKWAARIACDFLDEFGATGDLMKKVIPDGSGYGDWDSMPEGLIESVERWTYNLGFIDGGVDV